MALQSSGEISLSDVNVELGYSSTATISLGGSDVRGLFGVASGQIRLAADGYGKSNVFTFTITAAQTDANLATLATAAGWDGSTAVEATINSGVYISATSTSTPALTISGFSGGVTLINNGYIVGKGGNGGNAGNAYGNANSGFNGSSGSGGGVALSVSTACTVDNANGVIAGGGGGSGGGGGGRIFFTSGEDNLNICAGGGGGGGGRTSNSSTSGGSGGTAYYSSANAPGSSGNGGTINAAGNGGGGGTANLYGRIVYAGSGGTGGTWGASGNSGNSANASGAYNNPTLGSGGGGGSAGACTSGSANITWAATGTRYGTIG